MLSGQGAVQDTVTPTAGTKSVQPDLAFNCSAAPDQSWRLSLLACRLQACQAGQVEGSGLGDCHRVAPLLLQSLICPACTGLRAKAGDYLYCTSTPTTHCLLATWTMCRTSPPLSMIFTLHLHDIRQDTHIETYTFIHRNDNISLETHLRSLCCI